MYKVKSKGCEYNIPNLSQISHEKEILSERGFD